MMASAATSRPDALLNDLPGLQIRPMLLEDIEQVHQIDKLSFSMPWPESAFRYELLENPGSISMVAEIQHPANERQVVGVIVVWRILDEAHIATLAVHPGFRQRGISRRLLAEALKKAFSNGAMLATLEVRARNEAAQALYRRFGFEVVGLRPRYYRDNNEDAVLMTIDFERSGTALQAYKKWLESAGRSEVERPT
jgi:ribosomal-protein-alanine N-acetyltransferase